LAGEAGSVVTEYKKHLRDGAAHVAWKARLREELGDILWYAAALASHLELDLEDIARANLEKTADRWHRTSMDPFDDIFPVNERLPREGRFEFVTSSSRNGLATTRMR
jgi:NTP pyrophosphatase (non-canonical NTP hydrolase)